MSHINEALKKAQKDRDVHSLRYSGILAASGRKRRIFSGRTILWAIPLIIVIFLAFFYDSWLDFTSSQTPEPFEKDQERFQSTPKGTGLAKPRETVPGKPREIGLRKHQETNPSKPRESGLKERQETALGRPGKNGPRKLQETNPGKTQETYDRARQFHKEGRLEEARRLYEESLRLDPGYVDALNNLGVILISKRDYVAAQRSLEKAVRLKPRYAEPFYNLACLNAIRGDIKLALAQLKKAVSLDPTVRDWARKDTDLESLRHLPEFRELM
jgi:tetratricopeptide (TPR) repeat protein